MSNLYLAKIKVWLFNSNVNNDKTFIYQIITLNKGTSEMKYWIMLIRTDIVRVFAIRTDIGRVFAIRTNTGRVFAIRTNIGRVFAIRTNFGRVFAIRTDIGRVFVCLHAGWHFWQYNFSRCVDSTFWKYWYLQKPYQKFAFRMLLSFDNKCCQALLMS